MLGRAWHLLPQKKYIDTCAKAHGFVDHYIKQALADSNEQKSSRSLIQSLSAQTDDPDFIRSQVIQAMIAAQDTTSELLTNALFLLARHPKYWEQLRAEFVGQPEDALTAENLLSSKLMENILRESEFDPQSISFDIMMKKKNEKNITNTEYLNSFAPVPDLPDPRTHRLAGHQASRRGRGAPRPPPVHPGGNVRRDGPLRPAPRPRGLRRGRGGVPARAVGRDQAGAVGIPGIWRRPSGLSGTAEGDHRGLLCARPARARDRQAGEQGQPGLEGGAEDHVQERERLQSGGAPSLIYSMQS